MSYEETRPSFLSIALTAIPPILIASVFYLTDRFSAKPSRPQFHYAFLPLILMIISLAVSIINYRLLKDEEPEWGPQFAFKLLEGVNIAYIVISILLASLVIIFYFL